MSALPPELYRPILENLDTNALYYICLASSILRAEAEPFLYSSFIDKDRTTQLLFHRTVTQSPRLAQLVLKYRLMEDYSFFQADPRDMRATFWHIYLPEMLQSFQNLQVLSLREYSGASCSFLLRNCTFQLRYLIWGSCNAEPDLIPFLATQRELHTLRVEWCETMPELDPSSLPKLRTLEACGSLTVKRLLHLGSVTRLLWEPSIDDPFHDADMQAEFAEDPLLLERFRRLEHVRIGGYFSSPCLKSLVSFVPNLQSLEVIGARRNDDVYSIRALPNLRSAVFNFYHAQCLIPFEGRQEVVYHLFQECPGLQDIYVGSQSLAKPGFQWCYEHYWPIKESSISFELVPLGELMQGPYEPFS